MTATAREKGPGQSRRSRGSRAKPRQEGTKAVNSGATRHREPQTMMMRMPTELLRTVLIREWRSSEQGLGHPGALEPLMASLQRHGHSDTEAKFNSFSGRELQALEEACDLHNKSWSLEDISSLLRHLLVDLRRRHFDHIWSRPTREWFAAASALRFAEYSSSSSSTGDSSSSRLQTAAGHALQQLKQLRVASEFHSLVQGFLNARDGRGIYKLPMEILQLIFQQFNNSLCCYQDDDERQNVFLTEPVCLTKRTLLARYAGVNSAFRAICAPKRWAQLSCEESRTTQQMERLASAVKENGHHTRYFKMRLQLDARDAGGPQEKHRTHQFLSFIKHMPQLTSLDLDYVPEQAPLWIDRLERLQVRPPLRVLSLALSTLFSDSDQDYVRWDNILRVVALFPEVRHCRLQMHVDDPIALEDEHTHVMAEKIARQCDSLEVVNVDCLFTDTGLKPLLTAAAEATTPQEAPAQKESSAEAAPYRLTKLTLDNAGSHMVKGWALPMFANLTHLTLIGVFDGHFGMDFLSQPLPKLPSLVFLSLHDYYDTDDWASTIDYFRLWPFKELELGSFEALAPDELCDEVRDRQFPFNQVQKLRIKPESHFSLLELEDIEADLETVAHLELDIDAAIQHAQMHSNDHYNLDEDFDSDDPYYDEDEDYYLNDVLYGYPYYDSDDDYADYDATLGAFEFGLLDAMYHSLTAGQDFDYDAMLDRGLDGGDEDAWMTDDE